MTRVWQLISQSSYSSFGKKNVYSVLQAKNCFQPFNRCNVARPSPVCRYFYENVLLYLTWSYTILPFKPRQNLQHWMGVG